MKKLLFIMVACLAMIACKKETSNEPEQKSQVQQLTFNVSAFEQSTSPMNTPRKAPIYDSETNGQELTDLYLFDDTTMLAHQTKDDSNFGVITVELTHGSHNLSFVATRSLGQSVSNGILNVTSVRSTFGTLATLNVNKSKDYTVNLHRLHGMLKITFTEAIPDVADHMIVTIPSYYKGLNVTDFTGTNIDPLVASVSLAEKHGQTGYSFSIPHIVANSTNEHLSDVIIDIYDSNDNVLYSVTIDDVRFAANTTTNLSGTPFGTTGATFSINYSWNEAINGTF